MAISFVAAGAVGTGTNAVVTVPAGIQFSDLLVLTVSVGAAVAPSTPSGWSLLGSTTTTPRIYIYIKFADVTESSVTLSVASTTVQAVMCAYRGVSATDTISTFASATSTTIATNTLTTTYANEYIVSVFAMTTGAATWTAPGSTTERVNAAGTASLSGLLIVDELQAAAGVSAARTATSSVSKTLCAGSFSIIRNERYWVGGTATWDGTAGTKWSFTSGGTGGAPLPNIRSDVFFDSASGTVTCTITTAGGVSAKNLNFTGFTGTLAGGSFSTISGDITLVAGMTYNYTGTISVGIGSTTLISAGKSLAAITMNGIGTTFSLGGALTSTGTITVTSGTFTTNNYNVTASSLVSTGSSTRTINLGSSTLTFSATVPINFIGQTNLTLNPGTSQINITSNNPDIRSGGLTFYNVSFTAPGTYSINSTAVGVSTTFNNLTATAPAAAGTSTLTFNGPVTVNGTLSTASTAGNRRVILRSNTLGIAHTLTVNGTTSLTDCDFRDLYVVGTAAPISGTRIGDLRGCRGITFSTPKTVYWNLAGTQNWSANGWATTQTGTPSTDNFPLAQDTATFTNSGAITSITLDSAIPYIPTVDLSARTSAVTLSLGTGITIYGNWLTGSGVTFAGGGQNLTFSGRNVQTITSVGKTFSFQIVVDSYGGSVELADALNTGSGNLTVTNGTFDTKNFNVTCTAFTSSSTNVRSIKLGSSTLTLSGNLDFTTSTNLTFNAGTSTIIHTASAPSPHFGTNLTFYDLSFTGTSSSIATIGGGPFTCNNLSVTAPSSAGLQIVSLAGNITINGTLTVAGASPVRRIFVQSNTLGTTRTITANALAATDCDFRDITIAGAAAGSSPTRAGDCGGNSGITFPAAKTVYWNLSGAQNWSATAWATGSGGTPNINNFPLAQDTAVFNEAANSVTGTITINGAWNIGTVDMSARTSAMTLTTSTNLPFVYGDWKFGTGVTSSSTTGTITFAKRGGTQTITSNGVAFGCPVMISAINGTVQLADALLLNTSRSLNVQYGTFDAVTYNVTAGQFGSSYTTTRTVKMGSGTWSLTSTGAVWNMSSIIGLTFYKGTANITLTDTSTTARTFNGGTLSYNKLTIGGTTGISTLTIADNNQFTELASTKTVAHTIALGTTVQTFGKWTVTGTVGNVVTLTGTGTTHILAGACTSGIDYLAMGSIGFSSLSPGEFYAGANSTGTAAAPVYRTAKPADSTRYWVGGTGNWSDTARWSTTSGSGSGASVPRSHDDVVFNSGSNATAYTATVDAVTGGARCKSLTITGPASGNVTLAGSAVLLIHGNISLPATGLTRTYTGTLILSGSTTGKTITTNGVALNSPVEVHGEGCEWSLGSSLNIGNTQINLRTGTLNLVTYNLTAGSVSSETFNTRQINFGTGTSTLSGATVIGFGTTETIRAGLTVVAGTSSIDCTTASPIFNGNNQTFNNVSFTNVSAGNITLNGNNTFNNLSLTAITSAGYKSIILGANQTVTGTLTCSAGTTPAMRCFIRSDTLGTTRTITAAAVSLTDTDFRDITITGAAAPASGTRIGDCKGNSGITFTAASTRYWNLAAGGNWNATAWATGSGVAPNINNFPLPQDTCIIENTGLNTSATITINGSWNVGTINMSTRTNAMTLATSTNSPTIYGNWTNGTGTTISGTLFIVFSGRQTQTITSAGKTFTQNISIDSPGGIVRLLDALTISIDSTFALSLTRGTLDSNSFNVSVTGGTSSAFDSSNSNIRTINLGSSNWTIVGAGTPWNCATSTNLTVTGTGTINLSASGAKTFAGGSVNYGGITLDQSGAGTLSITGNNTFKNITNTYKSTGATTISLSTTTQKVYQFGAQGESGRVLTLTGTSAASPATLVLLEDSTVATDYLNITGIRAYPITRTWYDRNTSINNGSLGINLGGSVYLSNPTATNVDYTTATPDVDVAYWI